MGFQATLAQQKQLVPTFGNANTTRETLNVVEAALLRPSLARWDCGEVPPFAIRGQAASLVATRYREFEDFSLAG